MTTPKNRKRIKFIAIGAALSLFSSAIGYAAGEWENIWVQFDSVNLTVNGQSVTSSNLLYNDRTYVPLRACAEMLGSTVGWDQNSNTANITANIAGSADTAKVIKELKAAGELLDCFSTYKQIGSSLYEDYMNTTSHFNEVFDNGYEDDEAYLKKLTAFDISMTRFEESLSLYEIINRNAEITGIFFPDVQNIIENYSKAITYINKCYDACDTYESWRSDSNYDKIVQFHNLAYSANEEATDLVNTYYELVFDFIKNYPNK